MMKNELTPCFLRETVVNTVVFRSCLRVISGNTVQCYETMKPAFTALCAFLPSDPLVL